MSEEKQELAISADKNTELVAEICTNGSGNKEILICLRDKATGLVEQDLVLARLADKDNKEQTGYDDGDFIEVLLWSDGEAEDYTDRFGITKHDWDAD